MYKFTSRVEVEKHILDSVGPKGILESFSIPAETINRFFQVAGGGVGIYEWTDAHQIETRYVRGLNSYLFTNIERQDRRLSATRSSVSHPSQTEDFVRVLRILEYTGPRSAVEAQIEKSVTGTKTFYHLGNAMMLRAVTIGT
jgi:hypothetical protein